MKRLTILFALFTLISCTSGRGNRGETLEKDLLSEEINEYGFRTGDFNLKEGQIERGDFFVPLLTRLGVSIADAYNLTEISKGVFDLKTIKVGSSYKAFYTKEEDARLAYLVYADSKINYVVFGIADSMFVKVGEREVISRLRSGEATINSSLWNDVSAAGMSPLIALRLSEIYAWTVDFFGLQKGDSFSVLYEELYVGDKFFDIGEIYAALFTHAGENFEAYRFVQDNTPQYWNRKGENLRKAFLKAPLTFTRISSGFSYARRHPITRVVRPHTGVDYAAPRGTPVMSIGDGVVTQRAYTRGGGNQVKIKHNSVYTTAYLHLSHFAKGLSVGKRVRQGEIIGYVGSTGMSTGPHLDFRVWENGKPINPLKIKSPPADPLNKENKELFASSIERASFLRDSIRSVQYVDVLLNRLGVGLELVSME